MRETSEKVGGNIVGEWLLVKAEAQIGGGEERKVKQKTKADFANIQELIDCLDCLPVTAVSIPLSQLMHRYPHPARLVVHNTNTHTVTT